MAELKFPTLEEFGRQAGEWALDEFEYKGLTIREWADKITSLEAGEEPKRITFRLNGCDIWFTASAPEDITLKQLLIQCDKIHPNYCACGICTTDEENVELEIDYNSIKKIADCSCEIEEDADDETD